MSDPYVYQRERLIRQLSEKGIRDRGVLRAMAEVPRHLFVKEHLMGQAYKDNALPIGDEQTISQPYIVACMTEALALEPHHSVLEVGTGSGYQAAILAKLAARVYTLERISTLARPAIRRLRELGFDNVKVQVFDGTVGWSEVAPFDRILVAAGTPQAPQPLLDQLAEGGRMVVPEGSRQGQTLVLYRKTDGEVERRSGQSVSFVPLIGRHGWNGDRG